MLLEMVRSAITAHSMIRPGDRVLVAVSGGVDSIVLVHALRELAPELGCDLVVAHLDHGLRLAAESDARFVVDVAASLGLEAVCERADVAGLAASRRGGLEEAGRIARREFLARIADAVGASRIALGHTADDQAETILYRLARGTGWEGLCGMAPVSGRSIRPLLGVPRAVVREYAVAQGLPWREDETNEDVSFARNRIRERVMPEFALVHPGATNALLRTADLARDAREIERYAMEQAWPRVYEMEDPGSVRLGREALAGLPTTMQAVVLREAMRRARGDLRGIGRAHVAAVGRLAASPSTHGERHLPRLRVAVTPTSLHFWKLGAAAVPWEQPLALGWTILDEPRLAVEVAVRGRESDDAPEDRGAWSELADADRVQFPLVARSRRPGDRFAPLGMGRDVRLKSFLINARVPVERRDRLALVCDRGRIVWVAGVRLSDEVKLRASTRRVLVLRAEEVGR